MPVALWLAWLAICAVSLEQENATVGAFNVQIFGISKMDDAAVVAELLRICSRYDLLLLQEIRDSSQTALPDLVSQLNEAAVSADDRYNYTVGARQGRSASKEQYAYLYRQNKFRLWSAYDYQDPLDRFERDPYVAKFGLLASDGTIGFNFSAIGVHTKPSDVYNELQALVTVYNESVGVLSTNNSLLLGDFNADCSYLSQTRENQLVLSDKPNVFKWLILRGTDTTVAASDCSYDRFIIAGDELYDAYVNFSAVPFDYGSAYGLSATLTSDVSDHYPIQLALRVPEGTTDDGGADSKCFIPGLEMVECDLVIAACVVAGIFLLIVLICSVYRARKGTSDTRRAPPATSTRGDSIQMLRDAQAALAAGGTTDGFLAASSDGSGPSTATTKGAHMYRKYMKRALAGGSTPDTSQSTFVSSISGIEMKTMHSNESRNAIAAEASQLEDRPLPPGWERCFDSENRTSYYWCAHTGESQWERPKE